MGPLFSLNFVYLLKFAYPGSVGGVVTGATACRSRRADHGVAVDLAVDRIKIRLILSEERGDDAADPPAWTSNIGRHAIDGNCHTATHSLYSAAATPPTRNEVLVLGLLFSRVASDSRSVAGTVA